MVAVANEREEEKAYRFCAQGLLFVVEAEEREGDFGIWIARLDWALTGSCGTNGL